MDMQWGSLSSCSSKAVARTMACWDLPDTLGHWVLGSLEETKLLSFLPALTTGDQQRTPELQS